MAAGTGRMPHALFCAALLADGLVGLRTVPAGLRADPAGLRGGAAGLRDDAAGWRAARAFLSARAELRELSAAAPDPRETFTGLGAGAGRCAPRLNELAFAEDGRGLTCDE